MLVLDVMIVYVMAGLILAGAMFWTSGAVQNAAKATGTVLTIRVGSYSVGTTNVLVALGILSIITMVGVPTFTLWLSAKNDGPIKLLVKFDPPATGQQVRVTTDQDANFTEEATIRVYRSRERERFDLTVGSGPPLPIDVWYDPDHDRPVYSVGSINDQLVKDFAGESGSISVPLITSNAALPKEAAKARGTLVSVGLHALPDPRPVENANDAQAMQGASK
ncbi:MAG TPA: hypothetical protein VFB22_02120 [Candidatus Baltobacteraceae bacterium]|nr:hypothetical protein [Candidatus Baltobacteraceae bacterium]